jgi:hypothetical protein
MRQHVNDIECLALIVACLCHDLDHRGTNNSYQHKFVIPHFAVQNTDVNQLCPLRPVTSCYVPFEMLQVQDPKAVNTTSFHHYTSVWRRKIFNSLFNKLILTSYHKSYESHETMPKTLKLSFK